MKNQYPSSASRGLHITLWVVQVILAVMFVIPGLMKLFQPIVSLSAMLPWTGQVSPYVVRGLGIIDVLGGVGLILPSLLRIKPTLTVYAAYCGMALMFSAIVFHIVRGEASVIGFNFVLIAVLAFVAWGRTTKARLHAR